MEIESYVRGLARRRPDVVVTTLRLANLMGAGVDSHVTRYLSLPVVPRVMGFDARLQFLHPSDAVEALLLVDPRPTYPAPTTSPRRTSSRCPRRCGMMGRPRVGVLQPVAPLVATLMRQARLSDFSADQIDALTYGRAMDTTRFVHATGFTPRYTSRAALEEFAAAAPPGLLSPERVEGWRSSAAAWCASARPEPGVADAEIIQLGSRGPAGRGSRHAPVGRGPRPGRRSTAALPAADRSSRSAGEAPGAGSRA